VLSITLHRPFSGRSAIFTLGLALALASVVSRADGQARSTPEAGNVKQLWETAIADDSFEVEYKASAVSTIDSSVWLVVGRRAALTMSGQQDLALVALDRNGKILSETSLQSLAGTAGLTHVPDKFIDLAATTGGNIAVVLRSGGQTSVVTVDGKSRRVIQGKDIGAARPNLLVARAVAIPGGNLLLLGRLGPGAVAIKLDPKLAVVWERPADPKGAGVFTDAAVLSDENFVVTGTHSARPGSSDESSLWLGRLDAEGQVTKSIFMPGQFASVATGPDGGCALVQGMVGPQGADFWFRSYDRDLKEEWSTKLLSGTRDLMSFRIVPAGQGEYVVLGSEKHHLWISRVRAGAGVQWSQTFGDPPGAMPVLVWNFGLARAGSSVVVVTTDMVVNAKMQQRQIVRARNMDIR